MQVVIIRVNEKYSAFIFNNVSLCWHARNSPKRLAKDNRGIRNQKKKKN